MHKWLIILLIHLLIKRVVRAQSQDTSIIWDSEPNIQRRIYGAREIKPW
jgi:hypothetical protein